MPTDICFKRARREARRLRLVGIALCVGTLSLVAFSLQGSGVAAITTMGFPVY